MPVNVVERPGPDGALAGLHDHGLQTDLAQGVGGGEPGLAAADDEHIDRVHPVIPSGMACVRGSKFRRP